MVCFLVHFSPNFKARDRCHPAQYLTHGDLSTEWLLKKIVLDRFKSVICGPFSSHPLQSFSCSSRTRRRENYSQLSKTRTLIINSKKAKYLAFKKKSSRCKKTLWYAFIFEELKKNQCKINRVLLYEGFFS